MIIFLFNITFIIAPQVLFSHSETDTVINNTISNITGDFYYKENPEVVKAYSHHYDESKLPILFHEVDHVDHFGENITVNSSIDVIVQHCKELYQQSIDNYTREGFLAGFQNLLQGTGPLEPTLLFTGRYSPFKVTPLGHVYNLSFAFICILFATFIFSCGMMIHYSSTSVNEIFLAQSPRATYYSNEIFSCWDYCINDVQTAGLHHEKIVLELKAYLSEDRNKEKVSGRSLSARVKLFAVRLLINAFIISWLFFSLYVIYMVSLHQMLVLKFHNQKFGLWVFIIQYLPAITVAFFNCISPVLFDILVSYEQYSSRTSAHLSLVRNVLLYLSSIIMLLNTVQSHIACKHKDLCGVGLDETCHAPRCWETHVGQQLYKLTLVDLAVYFAAFFCYDLVQYFITWNFDNALTRYWGHPVFFLPTEVLAPIYSQTVLWLGVPYSPLLTFLMICKLIIIFYIKKAKILILCEPATESYRTSKFNSVFISILFVCFFFVLMVHSYALENIPPSRGCGPFRYFQSIAGAVPQGIRSSFSFLISHWFIMIAGIVACSVLHYYWRILVSQKELAKRLRFHLQLQSMDKQFLIKCIPNLSKKKYKEIQDRLNIRR